MMRGAAARWNKSPLTQRATARKRYFQMQNDKSTGGRVAVIGLGLTGVGTVKNLVEEGFEVVGFERNDWIGGLWHYSNDPNQTTVIKSTRANISKQRSCYQDFVFPDDVPDYPTGAQIATYVDDYAEKYKLSPKFRLGVRIDRLERSEDGLKWAIKLTDKNAKSQTETFDKVIVTTGPFHKPFIPECSGKEYFKGQILHAQAFKDPHAFKGKKVVVVGLSNTAGDVAVDVCDVAEETYMSHRSGAYVLSRLSNGKPLDHRGTRRTSAIALSLNATFPNLLGKVGAYFLERNMLKRHPEIQPSWGLLPARPIGNVPPTMNDYLISRLSSGKLKSVPGIKRFLSDVNSIEFTDGTVVQSIDTVIFATGYYYDYSILGPDADPTAFATPEWDSSPNANGLEYPRLYQGLFSTRHPQSLAFIGPFRGHSAAAFSNADLSSQAIAQIWKGNFSLPPQSEMEAWCDVNYASSLAQLAKWHIVKVGANPKSLGKFLNDAAGNGMNEMLSWSSWDAWKFWWRERKLCRLIMDGIDTPFVYRLFDGRGERGRKKWDGAKEAIFKANGLTVPESAKPLAST